jgi:hypothetical protein
LIIVCVTVLALAGIGAIAVLAAFPIRAGGDGGEAALGAITARPGELVVVHTRDERAIRGVVTDDSSGEGVVALKEATYLASGQEQPMGGVVLVPVDNIALTQHLNPVPRLTKVG